jgi:phage terminase small subunit
MSPKDKLTGKQRALVDALVTTGCTITEASQKAGYAKGEAGRVIASRTLRIPKVQQYMMNQISSTIGMGAIQASHMLNALSGSAKSEYVRLEASKDILDRVGLRAPDKVQHSVGGELSIKIDLD